MALTSIVAGEAVILWGADLLGGWQALTGVVVFAIGLCGLVWWITGHLDEKGRWQR